MFFWESPQIYCWNQLKPPCWHPYWCPLTPSRSSLVILGDGMKIPIKSMFHHRILRLISSPWIAMNHLGAGLDRSGERPDPKAHWGELFPQIFSSFFRMCLWWSFLYIYIYYIYCIYTVYIRMAFQLELFGIRGFYLCDHLSICQLSKCFPAGFSTHFALQTYPPHVRLYDLCCQLDGATGMLCISQIFPMLPRSMGIWA